MLALVGALAVTETSGAVAVSRPASVAMSQGTAANIQTLADSGRAAFHPGRLLVRFKAGGTRAGQQAVHAAAGATGILKEYHSVAGLQLVEVPADSWSAAFAVYANHPDVLYAEPDFAVRITVVPNDTHFDQLWGMHNTGQTIDGDPGIAGADIRAVEAWDVWTGDPDFRIAVIDTGVRYDHPDLVGNIWTNPGEIPDNGIDDDGNGYVDDVYGYDFHNDDSDPWDDHGHGTHVSGTIGAVGNNELGVVGVNWQCKIVGVKFIGNDGVGYTSDAIEAFQYVNDNGIRVSNNSWGSWGYSQALRDAIEATQAVGHIAVAAAGNGDMFFSNSQNNDTFPAFPASYDLPNIIAVAATTNDDLMAAFSNYGPTTVDLGAPGVRVYSTFRFPAYIFYDGTSMASPHVAGVVSLLTSRQPDLSWQEVKERILVTARPIAALQGITVTGGVVNALAAIGDCNENGLLDETDIAGGTSDDCNGNGVPDECEIFDCNANGIPDSCDLAIGTSDDCNGNGIPDECEPDCNVNGIADDCDLEAGTSEDCNANGIPDECEPSGTADCNGNATSDLCDIHVGSSWDCNRNDVPDECEGPVECRLGFSLEPISASGEYTIEGNRIILAESGQRVAAELFVSGWGTATDNLPLEAYQATVDASSFTTGWQGSVSFAQIPCTSPDDCRGGPVTGGICLANGFCNVQTVIYVDQTRPDFVFRGLPAVSGAFDYGDIGAGPASLLMCDEEAVEDSGVPKYGGTVLLDVSPDAAGTFTVGYSEPFTTMFVDDSSGLVDPLPGLHPLLITVVTDCNENGVPDHEEVIGGSSADCDNNGFPDECEPDCNVNGVADQCDIAAGTSRDCNGNQVPDECDDWIDCNDNGVFDACDIVDGTSTDCDTDGIPDECGPDTNDNGVPDVCETWAEVALLTASDGDTSERFGGSVAVDHNIAVVGVMWDDDGGSASGSALVYRLIGARWVEQAKLRASDAAEGDFFGCSVAVHGDVVVVGARRDDDNGGNSGSAYVFRWNGSSWVEQAKLTASDGACNDYFGVAVDVDEDTIVLGAHGNDDPEVGYSTGSAYVFRWNGSSWVEETQLTASDPTPLACFGNGVGVSGDTVVVGAYRVGETEPDIGAAYVFKWDGAQWCEQAKLTGSAEGGARFGCSVGIDGEAVVVGAYGVWGSQPGEAFVFEWDGNQWTEQAHLLPSPPGEDDDFGYSVAISGNFIVAGDYIDTHAGESSGSAYLFSRRGDGTWAQTMKWTASDALADDEFGVSVAIAGITAVIGAQGRNDDTGGAYVFLDQDCNHNGVLDETDIAYGTSQDDNCNGIPNECDSGEDLDCNGNQIPDACDLVEGTSEDCNDNNVPDECDLAEGSSGDCNQNDIPDECEPDLAADCNHNGVPDLCDILAGSSDCNVNQVPDDCEFVSWFEQPKLVAADGARDSMFGASVAVSGNSIVIGAEGDSDVAEFGGAAYVFSWDGVNWIEGPKLTASEVAADDYFGCSVAIDEGTIVVGSFGDDDAGSSSGSAYVFYNNGIGWAEQAKLTGSDADEGDAFGRSVAISGDLIVVGAHDPNDPGANAGAAYVFRRSGMAWGEEAKLSASDGAPYDGFGWAVAIGGDHAVVGAVNADGVDADVGAAYVFRWDGSSWIEQAKLTASDAVPGDGFGMAVATWGDRIAVGAPRHDGTCPLDQTCNSGCAYVFRWDGSNWVEELKLTGFDTARHDRFGTSIAGSGDVIVVGACNEWHEDGAPGWAYVFRWDGADWIEEAKLLSFDGAEADCFGYSVATRGDAVVVGAKYDDDACPAWSFCNSGSAYVYDVRDEDCNETGTLDECDLAEGTSEDCNLNEYPDECDVAAGTSEDCNTNGTPDECEADSDADGIIDECDNCDLFNPDQLDCQPNGVGDVCDLAEGTSQDCQPNGIPDECDITGGGSGDCNTNAVPDECETDSDDDGVIDDCDNCELFNPDQLDCQPNDVGDVCDLAYGTSLDCNINGLPDECDIAGGFSQDVNGNGIPDDCEANPPAEPPPPHNVSKNRYISFDPNNTERVAFQVELTASTYFPGSTGILGWVGEPDEHGTGRLVDEPFLSDTWPGVVHVGDCAIVPAAAYEIRPTLDGTTLSDPLGISTIAQPVPKYWADVVGEFDGSEWSAPNAVVNMDDVMAGVQEFEQLETAPPLTWVDLDPEVPNGVLNFTDIFRIVQGFKGEPYPFSDPAGCPP